MTDGHLATLRLLQISDSTFPSGGFAFSNGLETLVEEQMVQDALALGAFLESQVLPRWAGMDRWFVAHAFKGAGDLEGLVELDRLCEAHVAVDALGEASRRMGLAMLTTHARIGTDGAGPYRDLIAQGAVPGHLPIVQGLIGAGLGLSGDAVESASLYAATNGVLAAAVRLGVTGALEAQALLARASGPMADLLAEPLGDLPRSFTPLADIAVSRHAGHAGRLFAS